MKYDKIKKLDIQNILLSYLNLITDEDNF